MKKTEKKESFFMELASRNSNPASGQYKNTKHIVWNAQNITGKVVSKFTKTKRVSITEETMKQKSKIPGPNKYRNADFKKILGKTHGTYMKEPSRVSLFEEA